MLANLSIDSDLLEHALELSGEQSKEAVVNMALREFIARRRQESIIDWLGKLEWDESFDYKAERTRP
jgi:hypothetical protein